MDIIKRVKISCINKSYLKEQRVVMIGEICSNVCLLKYIKSLFDKPFHSLSQKVGREGK